MPDTSAASPVEHPSSRPREKGVLARLCAGKLSLAALIVTLLYFGAALFGEGYSIYCKAKGITPIYMEKNVAERYAPPSFKHILGTDYLGRDVALRAFFATKTAVKAGLAASLIAALAGVVLGLLAGYFGGIMDDIVVWIYSTFASMPSLLFILAFSLLVSKGFLFPPLEKLFRAAAFLLHTEPGMLAVYLGIGLTSWVPLCRVVRSECMRLRSRQYVLAAKVLGESHSAILKRHILPNLMHLVIVYFTMRFAFAVMTEVIVSYLGLGAHFEPSWGLMISDGQERLWRGVWWEVGGATLFMFFLVLALNILGDSLRDALDPRLRK